jgi:hypothetical protein
MKDSIASHRQGNLRQCAFELIGRSSELSAPASGMARKDVVFLRCINVR